MTPLTGWLAGSFGIKYVFGLSVADFTAASALCGSATSLNLPVGLIAAFGATIFMRETRYGHREPFDFVGFATLSLAIGALQMLVDRGELKDWFGSPEIWVEATIAGVALYLFIVHTATATDRSFLNRDLLKNLNFTVGTVLMFTVGLIMDGTWRYCRRCYRT